MQQNLQQQHLRMQNPNNNFLISNQRTVNPRESSCSGIFISKIKNKDAVHLSCTCCLLIILAFHRLLLSLLSYQTHPVSIRPWNGLERENFLWKSWNLGTIWCDLTRPSEDERVSVVGVTMETAETETNEAVLLCRNRLVLNRYGTPTTFFWFSYLMPLHRKKVK